MKKAEIKLQQGKLSLVKDPRVYAELIPAVERPYKRIVGLDLASSCGVTICDIIPGTLIKDATLIAGQWDLSISKFDTQSIRYLRLKYYLEVTAPDCIVYEEVKFTGKTNPTGMNKLTIGKMVARSATGASVVQGLSAVLTYWAEERDLPCQSVPIGTLKKYATGKGGAGKVAMIEACNKRFNTDFVSDNYEKTGVDNIADSMFLCAMGVETYNTAL